MERKQQRRVRSWLVPALALTLLMVVFLLVQLRTFWPEEDGQVDADGFELGKQGQVAATVSGGAESPGGEPIIGATSDDERAAAALLKRIQETEAKVKALTARFNGDEDHDEALRDSIRSEMDALRKWLSGTHDDVATAAILSYLESGRDALAGMGMEVGEEGVLDQSPSLRTLLLDLLATTDPQASVDFALALFDRTDSSDEWAMALRNIGWQDDGRYHEVLSQRLGQLLEREDWLMAPGAGFLEAFDLAVHLGDSDAVQKMGALVQANDSQGEPLSQVVTDAASLALERISMETPVLTTETIAADPAFMQQAPLQRAGVMARADVTDPQQVQHVVAYLQRPDVQVDERRTFLDLFPRHDGVLGDTLVSTLPDVLEFEQNLAADRAALLLVNEWLNNNRFPSLASELENTRSRLAEVVLAGNQSVPAANDQTFLPEGVSRPARSE